MKTFFKKYFRILTIPLILFSVIIIISSITSDDTNKWLKILSYISLMVVSIGYTYLNSVKNK